MTSPAWRENPDYVPVRDSRGAQLGAATRDWPTGKWYVYEGPSGRPPVKKLGVFASRAKAVAFAEAQLGGKA